MFIIWSARIRNIGFELGRLFSTTEYAKLQYISCRYMMTFQRSNVEFSTAVSFAFVDSVNQHFSPCPVLFPRAVFPEVIKAENCAEKG